jgi:hypothetical protein
LTRHGFSLAEVKSLTQAEARSYIELLADMARGKAAQHGNGQRIENQRLKRRKRMG